MLHKMIIIVTNYTSSLQMVKDTFDYDIIQTIESNRTKNVNIYSVDFNVGWEKNIGLQGRLRKIFTTAGSGRSLFSYKLYVGIAYNLAKIILQGSTFVKM